MSQRTQSIGVFDSGFGGLDVLRGLKTLLPDYDYVYLGDNARAPYGTRSAEEVYAFTKEAIDFLFAHGCSLIILACNTASSEALRKIQQEYLLTHHPDKRVLGVLIPTAEEAVGVTQGRVGVLATEGTVRSRAYIRELHKLNPDLTVKQYACPRLVPLIEAGHVDTQEMSSALEECVVPFIEDRVDTVILGCTHYGILKKKIRDLMGFELRIITSFDAVPKRLIQYLERHPEIEETLKQEKNNLFYTTGDAKKFEKHGTAFFGKAIHAEQVQLSA